MRAREWCAPPDACAREKMRRMRARHGVDSRRRTHKDRSADSPSKASSGIAVIWLLLRSLRARDEATRQLVGLKKPRRGAARRGRA